LGGWGGGGVVCVGWGWVWWGVGGGGGGVCGGGGGGGLVTKVQVPQGHYISYEITPSGGGKSKKRERIVRKKTRRLEKRPKLGFLQREGSSRAKKKDKKIQVEGMQFVDKNTCSRNWKYLDEGKRGGG